MEDKEQQKVKLLKLLNAIKEDTYKFIDIKDNDFIEKYNIREIENEYNKSIDELKKSDELCQFWFCEAFVKLCSIRYAWCLYDGFRKFMEVRK